MTETVGMDERTWLDALGDPHSVDMKVEERYRRVDFGHMEASVTFSTVCCTSMTFGPIWRTAARANID